MSTLFFPPRTLDDIASLNGDEVVRGYRIGIRGGPEPTDSRAAWAGWRNGMADSGRREVDAGQRRIAKQVHALGPSGSCFQNGNN